MFGPVEEVAEPGRRGPADDPRQAPRRRRDPVDQRETRRTDTCEAICAGGRFSAVVALTSFTLTLAGAGAVCRGTVFGCCQIDRWPRPPCSLFPLVCGTYLNGPGWYVGLLLFLNAYFVPKLLARYGETWRASPPSLMALLGWALPEALQYGLPFIVYVTTQHCPLHYHVWMSFEHV